MNKQEAIEKINNMATLKIRDTTLHQQFDTIDKHKALDIISLIDEPQKVVVPKCVYEMIKFRKEHEHNLTGTFVNIHAFPPNVFSWVANNGDLFAQAWLAYPNITVEKEKRYTVEIEGVSSSKLFKNIQTNNYLFHSGKGLKGYTDRLTETEIKQKDERLWQFAEEVEE